MDCLAMFYAWFSTHLKDIQGMDIEAIVAFLKELEVNNNKPWFDAQHARYKALRSGFTDLVQDIIYGLGAVDDRLQGVRADKSLFRINRDVRFSKDKSPYKTIFSAVLSPDGKNVTAPLYYLQIAESGVWMYAAGLYMPDPALATRIRHSIVAHASRVERILSDKALVAAYPQGLEGERYKRLPKGFDEKTPLLEIVRLKSFAMSREQMVKPGLTGGQLADTAIAGYAAAYPWVRFLREALLAA
jgi:uncharacterized protein (TIGR02453 family)